MENSAENKKNSKKKIVKKRNDIDSEIIKLLPNEYIDSLRAKIVEENKLEKLKDKELMKQCKVV